MKHDDSQSQPFAIVPVEVMMDNRLTLETMRVLMTLLLFGDKETGVSEVGREDVSACCGIHPSNISEATTKLIELGWIAKDGTGYTFAIPEAIAGIAESRKARIQKWNDNRRPNIPGSVKRYVFERDAYRCVKCASYQRLCVDHKYPYSLGGSSEPDNLQTLCWDCNSKKSNKVEAPHE